jgi:hypothetical protein
MRKRVALVLVLGCSGALGGLALASEFVPGREVSVPSHLAAGADSQLSILELIEHGKLLFGAVWTDQEGGGRPLTKGTGKPLADPSDPLTFPRNFNRISAPDANSCAGCHNVPRSGGGGDIVANVFVLGQRFDHITFDPTDTVPTHGGVDESGGVPTLEGAADSRATPGMFGSGYIEMLARQMTADLQALRNGLAPGGSVALVTKGVSFGTLRRNADGTWNTTGVEGLSAGSLASADAASPPSLVIKPFHQAGAVVSLREFTNNAFNHHHGMQSAERFGGTDVDGDTFTNELTSADISAATVFQAALPPPGRVIPRYRPLEQAVLRGEQLFVTVGCGHCHVPALPLDRGGWLFSEPNPFNPPGNLQLQNAHGKSGQPVLAFNLNSRVLPGPRLRAVGGVTMVPAFTDLKLHDITSGPDDSDRERLDMHQPAGSAGFFAGNGRFLTRKLWGIANEPPFLHHGKCTTMRDAIVNHHHGEAQDEHDAFMALSDYDQGSILEYLKTLRVLPEGAPSLIIDEQGRPRPWPP